MEKGILQTRLADQLRYGTQHMPIVDRQYLPSQTLDNRSTVWTRYAGSAEMQHLATQLVEIAQLIH
jgi:hypothetical protein